MTTEHPETKEEIKTTCLKKRMCNYFSFGIDSRIGYGNCERKNFLLTFSKKDLIKREQNQDLRINLFIFVKE